MTIDFVGAQFASALVIALLATGGPHAAAQKPYSEIPPGGALAVHAQTPARFTEADSAAILFAAVDHMLASDGGRPSIARTEMNQPIPTDGRPTVFIRIGAMPFGAWAAPAVARLRAWRWSYMGMAVDSADALALSGDPNGPTRSPVFPVELVLTLRFTADSAHVYEKRTWQTCDIRPDGMRAVFFGNHAFIRTPAGWSRVERSESGGVADVLCPHHLVRRPSPAPTGGFSPSGRTP